MDKFGKILIEYHYIDEDGKRVDTTVERNLKGGGEKVYYLKDTPHMAAMLPHEANNLATGIERTIKVREERAARKVAPTKPLGIS